ncbi:nucleotidyltransferase family protein [Frondihabitans australicus]|uniref:Nucleotidyltransferase-like protein n=1 Tax=Frondihabitans australicus TaxID=386892 RepID=A0A495IIZ2_9MICO|nr:nucleotidyltransferase domain-containing protein [Frondihabitans australicus]RKR75076.1 nucleotidyltransferase-like protein [Frondihabitans australicus]
MELSRLGADLIGPLESVILDVLSRSSGLSSGRQIERVGEITSHAGAQRALQRLEDIGLVVAVISPSAYAYSVNREHVFWPAIEVILGATRRIESEIVRVVREKAGDETSVAVFGSYARGEAIVTSDIDLLVVFPDDLDVDAYEATIGELHDVIEPLTGNLVQVFDVSRSTLLAMTSAGDSLVASLRRDARLLTGPSIRPLLREAAA